MPKLEIPAYNLSELRLLQMKLKSDPRHQERVTAVKNLFEKSFRPQVPASSLAKSVFENRKQIDKLLKKYAPAWPLSQIPPIDLAILRLAIYELLFKTKREPYKVIVDEAVEIAKEYGNKSSGGFVNGVLGTIIKLKLKN